QVGGMENMDAIDTDRAVLREIIEERYVSGFSTYMPFNDARRLRASDSDVIVPFPLNNATTTVNPQRFLYPQDEIDGNSNIPNPIPDLFTVTPVNQ
ncbi:MAG: SusD/RagB family nutrient-binding outer membrane lipoprotein, partial [Bacteroidota bacterium]